MQGAAGQAALRQAGIESGQAERQRLARTFPSGQQAAQLRNHGTAIFYHGKAIKIRYLAAY
jgi:hypothetical protein